MEKRFCLVTTTIRVPKFLEAYLRDAEAHGRRLVAAVVAGDRKPPPEAASFCRRLEKRRRIPCRDLSPREQTAYLKRWPSFRSFLPWNCIQRRAVALRAAYDMPADAVVTLDDDNFIAQADYLSGHSHLGERRTFPTVSSR